MIQTIDFQIDVQVDIQIDDEFIQLVDPSWIEAAARMALQHCEVDDATLSIVITNDEQVQQLNRQFRAVDAPTDVLSFPAYEEDEEDEDAESGLPNLVLPPELAAETERYLGDIIIAYPYAVSQAERYHNRIDAELRLLTVHGVLHLLGYDHADKEEADEMWSKQAAILAHFGDQVNIEERVME